MTDDDVTRPARLDQESESLENDGASGGIYNASEISGKILE